jgi:hypothetical protein
MDDNPEHADAMRLFKDLSEHRITFADFLIGFAKLPKSERDRLLAINPKLTKTKTARA